jgi:hypothetical protein
MPLVNSLTTDHLEFSDQVAGYCENIQLKTNNSVVCRDPGDIVHSQQALIDCPLKLYRQWWRASQEDELGTCLF